MVVWRGNALERSFRYLIVIPLLKHLRTHGNGAAETRDFCWVITFTSDEWCIPFSYCTFYWSWILEL